MGSIISDIFGGGSNNDAANASLLASQTQAQWQQNALNYLKQTEQIPQQFRQEGLQGLAGIYGLPGGTGTQQEAINQAQQSPLYRSLMSGLGLGEEQIMKNAAATGGLRSGNTQYNLADYATRLQNNALLQSYNQQLAGLQGLAQLPSNANNIATMMSNIGSTYGQGITATGQAQQTANQNQANNLLGLGSMLLSGSTSGGLSGLGGLMSLGAMF